MSMLVSMLVTMRGSSLMISLITFSWNYFRMDRCCMWGIRGLCYAIADMNARQIYSLKYSRCFWVEGGSLYDSSFYMGRN